MFNQVILAKIPSLVQNLTKEITVRTIIHNYEGVVLLLNDTMKCDDIPVCRGKLVKSNLLQMETSLSGGVSCWCVKKAFDGVGWCIMGGRAQVDCAINDP